MGWPGILCYQSTSMSVKLIATRDTRMRQVNFQTFNVTKSSVHVSCRHVCDAIKNNVAEHLIKWQLSCLGNERIWRTQKSSCCDWGNWWVTHSNNIKAPQGCPENYIKRKDFHSIVLQACCDHEMYFTNCFCGWPESVHHSRVLQNSDIFYSASKRYDYFFP